MGTNTRSDNFFDQYVPEIVVEELKGGKRYKVEIRNPGQKDNTRRHKPSKKEYSEPETQQTKIPHHYFRGSQFVPRYEREEILKKNNGDLKRSLEEVEALTKKRSERVKKDSQIEKMTYFLEETLGIQNRTRERAKSFLEKSSWNLINAQNIARTTYKKKDPKKKSKLSTPEGRREYQRRYYQLHKEKAKEYQRQYNLTHKKKARGGRGKAGFEAAREAVKTTFNLSDIQNSPMGKTEKMLESIIKRERETSHSQQRAMGLKKRKKVLHLI